MLGLGHLAAQLLALAVHLADPVARGGQIDSEDVGLGLFAPAPRELLLELDPPHPLGVRRLLGEANRALFLVEESADLDERTRSVHH